LQFLKYLFVTGLFQFLLKLMFVACATGQVDLAGFKALSALLRERMFILDLPVVREMPWE